MNPLAIMAVKKIGLMLISRKLNENPLDAQNSDFDKKELKKAVPAWAAIVTMITALVTSPEFISLIGAG